MTRKEVTSMAKSDAYLIGITDCTQDVCAASGRISTQSGTALEIFERSHDEEKNTNLISKVTRSGHTSTIEHIFFNLAFENVSVVVEQFMIEFRLASFTVKSRRYVNFSDAGFYVPEFNNEEIAPESFKEKLLERLVSADMKQVKADVLPFIRNPKELDIWSNDYFVQLADMIKTE